MLLARLRSKRNLRGQAMAESILMLPLYFLFVFAFLQVLELGLAAIVAHYAASSVARMAVQNENFSGTCFATIPEADVQAKVESLMFGGFMKYAGVKAAIVKNPPTADVSVVVRLEVAAFPFVNTAFHAALTDSVDGAPTCVNNDVVPINTFGPFNFSANPPYLFYVNGRSIARMNYQP